MKAHPRVPRTSSLLGAVACQLACGFVGCGRAGDNDTSSDAKSDSTSEVRTGASSNAGKDAPASSAVPDDDDDGDAAEAVAPGEIDFLAEPTKVPSVFAGLPKPTQVIGLKIKGARVLLDALDNANPGQGNAYWYRKGAVDGPHALSNEMVKLKTGTVLDLDKIDFAILSRIIPDAKTRAASSDGNVTAIDLMNGKTWRVRIKGSRTSNRFDYALDGTFQKMK